MTKENVIKKDFVTGTGAIAGQVDFVTGGTLGDKKILTSS